MKLLLASKNLYKIQEIQTLLSDLKDIELISLFSFPDYCPPEETGQTFEENALLKAIHASTHLNIWALADDSGLVVPALQGRPGIFSARFSGDNASDEKNRKKLLREMNDLKGEERSASFFATLALVSPDGFKQCVTGTVSGHIAFEERGNNGFGYDPLFIPVGYEITFGQMKPEEKNRISHRSQALQKMHALLQEIISK